MDEQEYQTDIDACIASLNSAKSPKSLRLIALASAETWLKEAMKKLGKDN